MKHYDGPRSACQDLASLVDDIGDPIIVIINNSSLSEEEKIGMRTDLETILTEVFLGEKMFKIRDYIHDSYRGN